MEIELAVLVSGLAAGLAAGLLGIGGGAVLAPLLIYLPPLFGADALGVDRAGGLSIALVLVAGLTGVVAHRTRMAPERRYVLLVGLPGALAGAVAAAATDRLPDLIGLSALGLMAALAVILLRAASAGAPREEPAEGVAHDSLKAMAIGSVLGVGTGLSGAGGAWLLLPLLTKILRVPFRRAVTTSLAIASLAASAAFIGKTTTGQIPFGLVPWGILGVVPAVFAGTFLSHRWPVDRLRRILLAMVLVLGIRVWIDVLWIVVTGRGS